MGVRGFYDVAVHGQILFEEAHLVVHVGEEATNFRGKMDHVRRPHLPEELLDLCLIGETAISLPSREIKLHRRYDGSENTH